MQAYQNTASWPIYNTPTAQSYVPQYQSDSKYHITPLLLDWLQSLKQLFINAPYHILVVSSKTEPSELDWLQVYDKAHWWKIVLLSGASLLFCVFANLDLDFPFSGDFVIWWLPLQTVLTQIRDKMSGLTWI